ncbi:MAG: hypothetical protein ACOYBQ_06820 [Fluviibacter sp.]
MDEKVEFAERLKKAMTDAGYEPRPGILEKGFNTRYWGRSVTFQAAYRWLKGLSIPEQEKLVVLAEWLGIEPQVLRYGAEASSAAPKKKQRWDEAISGPEREVLQDYLALPATQRKMIREIIQTFVKANTLNK